MKSIFRPRQSLFYKAITINLFVVKLNYKKDKNKLNKILECIYFLINKN